MSRIGVSTVVDTNKTEHSPKQSSATATENGFQTQKSRPMRVLVLGDFSGRSSQAECLDAGAEAVKSIDQRRLIAVDKDNFDDVFASLNVAVKTPLSQTPLTFSDIDELHPDYLFEHLDVFDRFRIAAKKLKKCKSLDEAVGIVERLGLNLLKDSSGQKATKAPETHAQAINEVDANDVVSNEVVSNEMDANEGGTGNNTGSSTAHAAVEAFSLDSILTQQNEFIASEPAGGSVVGLDIQALIRDAVRPFSEPKADQGVDDILQSLWRCAERLMQGLMHDSAFKNTESLWRSLDLVNRRLDTDRMCKLHLLDVTAQELRADFTQNTWEVSDCYKAITGSHKVVAHEAFDVIVWTEPLNTEAAVHTLSQLGAIAQSMGGSVFSSAGLEMFGCTHLSSTPQATMWEVPETNRLNEQWQALRNSDCASSIFSFAPDFLLRLPYGSMSPIDAFNYYEIGGHEIQKSEIEADTLPMPSPKLLWGSGAFVGLMVASSVWENGSAQANIKVDNLPFYVYNDTDGEACVQPSSAVVFSDASVLKLRELGVNTLLGSASEPSISLRSLASITPTK